MAAAEPTHFLRLMLSASDCRSPSCVVLEVPPFDVVYVGNAHIANSAHVLLADCSEAHHAAFYASTAVRHEASAPFAYFVADCGSAKGTFVNDKRLSAAFAASAPLLLRHLDRVKIGSSVFVVHFVAHPAAAHTAAFCDWGNDSGNTCSTLQEDAVFERLEICAFSVDCPLMQKMVQCEERILPAAITNSRHYSTKKHSKKFKRGIQNNVSCNSADSASANSLSEYNARVMRLNEATNMHRDKIKSDP